MWTEVPIVDLSAFGPSGDEAGRTAAAEELRKAFTEVGFVYIRGHGCPEQVSVDAFQSICRLFDMPPEEKIKLDARNSPLYRGYNSAETGAHSCTPEKATLPDLKESFTLGAENKIEGQSASLMHGPNQWPSEQSCPGFEKAMRKYWSELIEGVAVRLMRALALSLGMDDIDFFCRECDDPVAQMVLLRYPPEPVTEKNKEPVTEENKEPTEPSDKRRRQGCGAHTDCGFLTILAQDANEGLEVRRADGAWVKAPPIPGTFVINLGDMAAQWTNNLYKSTEHRVYNPSSTATRHSIPFFINCNFDTKVECIPQCRREGVEEFPPVKAGEYILKKLGLMHMLSVEDAKTECS
eukprot:TRINITY_DN57639_c0_g1_i1.p1 TRINITY_DN57639_c0_g1~~TRINITY_DN57639_c0_g1_i1.p1  ORF type:complete len:351 (-),score=55.69 TRINITY_DN57639_c0_g1_i1:137-1189(-)